MCGLLKGRVCGLLKDRVCGLLSLTVSDCGLLRADGLVY